MSHEIQIIPLANLSLIFIPVLAVVGLIYKWSLDYRNAVGAIFRMLVQLLLIGYFLTFLFQSDSALIILAVLIVMLLVSSRIALRTSASDRGRLYPRILISLFIGCGLVLSLVTQGVLRLEPWYFPRYLIPLAGLILANSLNGISLAVERAESEIKRGLGFGETRSIAFRTALIPTTNSLFAVGLVSLPGMMTGQILSGVSPLIAARYQIMVMAMTFGATGISTACFLMLSRRVLSGIKIEKEE